MMILSLLATTVASTSACTPSSLNINSWISINMLVVVVFLAIVSAIYAFSNLLPSRRRESLRRILIAEYAESLISIFIIAILVSFAYATCSAGAAISGLGSSYTNIFQADNVYVGQLLFGTGTALASQLFIQGYLLSVNAQISNNVLDTISKAISPIQAKAVSTSATGTQTALSFNITYNGDLTNMYDIYENVYTTYAALVVVTFGVLLLLFLILPVISGVILPFLLPFVIIMRSLAFTGPKLRETANTLLALCVAFYFVLPLAISMNGYIVNWVYCNPSLTVCNPYVQYAGSYNLNQIPVATFFTQNTAQLNIGSATGVPTSFFGSVISGTGGIAGTVKTIAQGLANLPGQVSTITNNVAEYMFEGIVLVALDFVITMGFAQGLTKGLNAIPGLLGAGPFWGG